MHVNSELCAVIDIQSGLVRGSIVDLATHRILFLHNHPFNIKTNSYSHSHSSHAAVDPGMLTKKMLHHLHEVAAVLARQVALISMNEKDVQPRDMHLADVHFVLASPWVMSQSKKIKIAFDKPTVITDNLIKNIIEKSREGIGTVSGAVSKGEGGTVGSVGSVGNFAQVLLEEKIFDVKLNGYSMTDFVGKTADEIEIAFAFSVTSRKLMDKIIGATRAAMLVKNNHFHSALLLEYVGLRNALHDYSDYMVIHAHNELTDVVVVKNNLCTFISSYPVGIATLIRKIAKSLHMSPTVAESTLNLFNSRKLSGAESERIRPIVEAVTGGWLHDLEKNLSTAGDKFIIPRLVVLSAHSHFDLFSKLLNEAKSGHYEVQALQPTDIEKEVSYERSQDKSLRMGLYTIAISTLS